MRPETRDRMKRVGRWVALPVAVLAALIVGPLLFELSTSRLFEWADSDEILHGRTFGGSWISGPLTYFMYCASNLALPIYVGAAVAPSHKKTVSVVLCTLCGVICLLAVAALVMTLRGPDGWEPTIKEIIRTIGFIAGTVLGLCMSMEHAEKESPSASAIPHLS